MEGESGRNELLRGPFALFGVRISAKLVRDLAKHRRTPMSPSAIDSAYFPGADFCRGRKTQAEIRATPNMVRSGRVLPTSVKSPFNSALHTAHSSDS